jgi:hypothetical protein
MHLDFDTFMIDTSPKDSDGYLYRVDLFTLMEVLAPNRADDYYQSLTKL